MLVPRVGRRWLRRWFARAPRRRRERQSPGCRWTRPHRWCMRWWACPRSLRMCRSWRCRPPRQRRLPRRRRHARPVPTRRHHRYRWCRSRRQRRRPWRRRHRCPSRNASRERRRPEPCRLRLRRHRCRRCPPCGGDLPPRVGRRLDRPCSARVPRRRRWRRSRSCRWTRPRRRCVRPLACSCVLLAQRRRCRRCQPCRQCQRPHRRRHRRPKRKARRWRPDPCRLSLPRHWRRRSPLHGQDRSARFKPQGMANHRRLCRRNQESNLPASGLSPRARRRR